MSQSSYFKSRPDLLTLGGVGEGSQKSWKTLRVERSGCNLLGRISTCYRYLIDIIGTVLFTLEELGSVDLEKLKQLRNFYLKNG